MYLAGTLCSERPIWVVGFQDQGFEVWGLTFTVKGFFWAQGLGFAGLGSQVSGCGVTSLKPEVVWLRTEFHPSCLMMP